MSRDGEVREAYDIDELWPDEAEIGAMLRTHFRQHPSDLVMLRHLGELEQVAASVSTSSSHAVKRMLIGAGVAAALLLAVLTGTDENLGKTEAVGDNPVQQSDPLSWAPPATRADGSLEAGTLPATIPTSERGSIGPPSSTTTNGEGSARDRSGGGANQPRATAAPPATSASSPDGPTTTATMNGPTSTAPVSITPTFTLPTTDTAPPDAGSPADGQGETPTTTTPEPTTTATTPPPPTTTCVNLDLLGLIRSCNGQLPSLFDLIGGLLPF